METLKCDERIKNRNHSARKNRNMGKIPGVLYSSQLGNVLFEVGELELNREISKSGEHSAISVLVNNAEHKALIKEVQKEPVTQRIVHIDLQEIDEENIIQKEVPIVFTGEALASKNGGIVQKERNSIKVQGKYNLIPKSINIDVSNISNGNIFRIADIEIGNEITFLDDINTVLAVVNHPNLSTLPEENNLNSAETDKKPSEKQK
ncbi:MAG: 50S ribosomal protein L25 [Clostridium sp.]|nr:50S ribosomal protein L25 [Clostridium sp.]